MADEGDGQEYVCPQCDAPVEVDAAACPSCGVEFAPAGEPIESAPPAEKPAPAEGPEEPPEELPVESPDEPPSSPGSPSTRDSDPLPASGSTKGGTSKGARPFGLRASPLGHFGGLRGTLGLLLLLAGVLGVVVGANYDTWIRGATQSNIGSVQQIALAGAAAVAAVGAALFLRGRRSAASA